MQPAGKAGPFLYVGGWKLSMYALGSSKPLHLAVENPVAVYRATLALDRHGHLCEGNGEITYPQLFEYDAQTLQVMDSTYGVGSFSALVANRSGYIYEASSGAGIGVYAPGCEDLLRVIHRDANAVGPLVFDRSGNLYAGIQPHYAVSIYAPAKQPGNMKPVRQIRNGLNGPNALAVGPSGELFVANYTGNGDGYITVYAPGGSTPTLKITKDIDEPLALAVDSKGRLYVANDPRYGRGGSHGWISVYAPGRSQPVRKVRVYNPVALALDPSDNLYVANPANHSSVLVYNAGATKLVRTITSGVDEPSALLIGSP